MWTLDTLESVSGRARFPFSAKLVLLVTLSSVVPLGVVGLALIDVNSDAVRTALLELQLAVVGDVVRTIESELVEAQNGLDSVGRALSDQAIGEEVRASTAITLVEASEALDHAAVYAADRTLIDVIREQAAHDVTLPRALPDALCRRAVERNVATGSVSIAAGGPRVLLVVPIRPAARVTGYVASFVSLDRVQARVERLAAAHFPDRADSLFVVDERLRIVAHPDVERAHALASARRVGILRGIDPRSVGPSFVRSGEIEGPDGVAMVGTVVGLEGHPWIVAAQVPRSVAYASLDTMRTIVIATVALAIAIALVVGLFFSRRITAPIQALSDFARDLAARRFDRRVRIETRDELSLLGDAMSTAAADLEASDERIRREIAIRADLGRYLPAELVDKVVRREQDMALGGRRAAITVLFADVVAFTPLTEKHPPEVVVGILNELFTILTEIVFRHGGTVDKFVGDCVMAIWGAPTPLEDHARRALSAAEDMLRWLEVGNAGWEKRHGVRIQLAIGVHTGEAVVGNVGSETRMEYTAIGDVVNVAARLEAIARPQQILVSSATREAAGDGFAYIDLGLQQMAGRAQAVHLYEVRL